MPVGGSLVKMIEYSTGKEATLIGKPNPAVFDIIEKIHKIDRKKCLMIGDSLNADIGVATKSNVDSFLVFTGHLNEDNLEEEIKKRDGLKPTYYWNRVEI